MVVKAARVKGSIIIFIIFFFKNLDKVFQFMFAWFDDIIYQVLQNFEK